MMTAKIHAFELGVEVADIISGVKGIITARTEFINGCVQYTMSPKAKPKAESIPESYMIDVDQLKQVGVGISKKKKLAHKDRTRTQDAGGPTISLPAKRGPRG